MVCMDAFIVSHTQMETDLPEQDQVDRYLPPLDLPHRMRTDAPRTLGGLVWPDATVTLRKEIHEAFERVPAVFEECRAAFREVFGRNPAGALGTYRTEDADTILVATASIATTALEVVKSRRDAGEKVGLVTLRMLRPFPEDDFRAACASARRLGVLDRNYAAGLGGIWHHEIRGFLQGHRDDLLVQGYLTGIGGGDVTRERISEALDDLTQREIPGGPVWVGLHDPAPVPAPVQEVMA
jgi:pyruvate/2-oxoacid:ferredoxin oxidoreductase alpha subunit